MPRCIRYYWICNYFRKILRYFVYLKLNTPALNGIRREKERAKEKEKARNNQLYLFRERNGKSERWEMRKAGDSKKGK